VAKVKGAGKTAKKHTTLKQVMRESLRVEQTVNLTKMKDEDAKRGVTKAKRKAKAKRRRKAVDQASSSRRMIEAIRKVRKLTRKKGK